MQPSDITLPYHSALPIDHSALPISHSALPLDHSALPMCSSFIVFLCICCSFIVYFQIFIRVVIMLFVVPCIIPCMCHNNVSCYTEIGRRVYRGVYTDLSYLHVHMYVAVCGRLSCVRSQLLICRNTCVYMFGFVLLTCNWRRG